MRPRSFQLGFGVQKGDQPPLNQGRPATFVCNFLPKHTAEAPAPHLTAFTHPGPGGWGYQVNQMFGMSKILTLNIRNFHRNCHSRDCIYLFSLLSGSVFLCLPHNLDVGLLIGSVKSYNYKYQMSKKVTRKSLPTIHLYPQSRVNHLYNFKICPSELCKFGHHYKAEI